MAQLRELDQSSAGSTRKSPPDATAFVTPLSGKLSYTSTRQRMGGVPAG